VFYQVILGKNQNVIGTQEA